MPSKRKRSDEGAKQKQKVQRRSSRKDNDQRLTSNLHSNDVVVTHTVGGLASNEHHQNLDLNSLTKSITESVTAAVLENLKTIGVLPNVTPTNLQSIETPSSIGLSSIAGRTDNNAISSSLLGTTVTTISNVAASSSTSSSVSIANSLPVVVPTQVTAFNEAAKSGFVSAAVPLHYRVPIKTKEKIWSNEFVELSNLQDEVEDGVTIKVKSGEITTTGNARRKFLNIEQWTDAFNVFASVYRLKYPEQAEQLASYMGIVRKISNEGGAWYYYDTNFRKIRAAANFAWDQIHSEIYVTALSRKQNTTPRFRSGRDLSGRDRSRGPFSYTCNKFNKGTHCAGCDYRHICKHCGGKHPAFRCYGRPNKPNGNETNEQQSDEKSKPKPSRIPQPTNSSQLATPK